MIKTHKQLEERVAELEGALGIFVCKTHQRQYCEPLMTPQPIGIRFKPGSAILSDDCPRDCPYLKAAKVLEKGKE